MEYEVFDGGGGEEKKKNKTPLLILLVRVFIVGVVLWRELNRNFASG